MQALDMFLDNRLRVLVSILHRGELRISGWKQGEKMGQNESGRKAGGDVPELETKRLSLCA